MELFSIRIRRTFQLVSTIYTESKAKFMLFSEKEYSMSWYAKGVGIVKEERYNKRGKLQESMTLEAIRKQGNN